MATKAVTPKVFDTKFDPHSRILAEPGSGIKQVYTAELSPNGEVNLIPSGEDDMYAEIQSHRDSVDIHVLLARYRNGDLDALSRRQGLYGDFTQYPTNYAELLNTVIQGKSYFESLPVETREKFDHSFEKFMLSMDDMQHFAELMGFKVDETPNEPSPSVENAPVENTTEVNA